MKYIITLFILLFACCFTNAQTDFHRLTLNSGFQHPQAVAPAPEIRNLLQFTSTPVSEYTGVPDISIPLFSFDCTRDLKFNLALKYHTDAVKREEKAGVLGLGWSLKGGGVITRVVRGLPDERLQDFNNAPNRRLHTMSTTPRGNDLDNFIDNPNYVFPDEMTLYDKLFEAHESGVFDTQYDIYHYDFMGYSGSFYLKMNNNLSAMTVVKLDNSNMKITVQFTKDTGESYNIDSFTLYDENGNKYFFDVKEKSSYGDSYYFKKMFQSGNVWENAEDFTNNEYRGFTRSYISSYHLTSVTPYTATAPMLTFSYNTFSEYWNDYTEVTRSLQEYYTTPGLGTSYINYVTERVRIATGMGNGYSGIRDQFGNASTRYVKAMSSETKKLSRINYMDKLYIDFTYGNGRNDKNYTNIPTKPLAKLDGISIYSTDLFAIGGRNKKQLKKYAFTYASSASYYKKSLLKGLTEYKDTTGETLKKEYGFYYNKENQAISELEDKWGFVTSSMNRDTDPNQITSLVLEKMTVPTGGCIVYKYEPHTYSYIGSAKQYSNTQRTNVTGGGIRIKTIGYFDDKNTSQNYYNDNLTSPVPAKEISYNYNLLTESFSSGSLTFPVPVFEYNQWVDLFGEFCDYNTNNPGNNCTLYLQPNQTGTFYFRVKTDYNNLLSLTTQGSNVGYKNVTVTERDNGKKELTFTSPIDFPEENYTVTYPFMPSKNVDYKRGLLLNEKNYNSGNTLVSETKNTYTYSDSEVLTGILPIYRNGINCRKTFCLSGRFISYDKINSSNVVCHPGLNNTINGNIYYAGHTQCLNTTDLMDYKIEKRVVGWAKLSRTERIDYLPSAVSDVMEYTYNSINKKPGSVKKTIGSNIYLTEYDYLNTSQLGFPNRYNRIADVSNVKTKLNNELLATENILFKDIQPNAGGIIQLGSQIYVPEKYQYAKGTNVLEDVQTITRLDDRGNPLEVKRADGTYTTFIWGYNKTRLIATIENCRFSEIENLPVYTTLLNQTYSIFSNGTTVSELLESFATLRSSLSITKKVTSLVYEWGKGVVCKTDANGKTVYYKYNSLGNLEEVRDNDNNLLKQYFEFYKN